VGGYVRAITEADLAAANHREYDRGVDPLLQLLVYGPVHGGWAFTNVGGHRVLDHLGARAALRSGSRVLELCCGLADTCRYLAIRYGCAVTGLELNHAQVEAARVRLAADRIGGPRVRVVEADALAWTPDRGYDAVLTVDALMMIHAVDRALAAAFAALRPGGVLVLGEVVPFTTKEFDLLRFLAERSGLALSRQQILDGVWGYDWFGDVRTVDVHIAQVRKKVADAVQISTVRGIGYRLDAKR